jgi:hypothetical protein
MHQQFLQEKKEEKKTQMSLLLAELQHQRSRRGRSLSPPLPEE